MLLDYFDRMPSGKEDFKKHNRASSWSSKDWAYLVQAYRRRRLEMSPLQWSRASYFNIHWRAEVGWGTRTMVLPFSVILKLHILKNQT